MSDANHRPGRTRDWARIRFIAAVVIACAIPALVIVPLVYRYKQAREQLLEQGQLATAEILSVRETGNYYNREPEVRIKLKVQPREGDAFSVEVTKVLSLTELAKYTEGSIVDLLYDPNQPDAILFVEVERINGVSETTSGSEGSAK